MLIFEKITAKGIGYWGMPLHIDLATAEYTLTNKWSDSQSKVSRFIVHFSDQNHHDKRIFHSDEERNVFLEKNITNLNISPAEGENNLVRKEYYLSKLYGEPLVSVTFIHNYLQLQFGVDHRFSFFVWPIVEQSGKRIKKDDPGYRDNLCSFISTSVVNVDEYLDAGLVFEFDLGAIEIPLEMDEKPFEPEIAMYQGPGEVWQVWRKGEEFI